MLSVEMTAAVSLESISGKNILSQQNQIQWAATANSLYQSSCHGVLWSSSLSWHTTLHRWHQINFLIARLWDDQLSVSPDIQSASAPLYWIWRLITDKYKEDVLDCVYLSFLSRIFEIFLTAFQPISIFIELSHPLLPFSYALSAVHPVICSMLHPERKRKI